MTNSEAIKILKDALYDENTSSEYLEAVKLARKALEQTRWIPCSERLPEEGECYLVTTKWKGSYSGDVYVEIDMAEYKKKQKEWDYSDIVVAWMPLPQPYKEGDTDAG